MNCARSCPALLAVLCLVAAEAAAVTPPQLWTFFWNGPGNHDDRAYLSSFDATGNLYVAGSTYRTDGDAENFFLWKYLPGGAVAWVVFHGGAGLDEPSDMVVTGDGSVLLTGYARENGQNVVATLAYNSNGSVAWLETVAVVGSIWIDSHAPALATDSAGNVLVCVPSDDDYLILKYAPDGTSAWARTWDGPASGIDRCADVAVDALGNVFVTGMASTTEGGGQATGTIKLDANGNFQWEHIETGVFGAFFDFAAVEVTPGGNVVVVANPESDCGVFQARVWSLDPATGGEQWLEWFPADPCDSVEPVDMAIATDGSVAITGFGSVSSSDTFFQTLLYGPDGTFAWHREYDGPGSSTDMASALTFDAGGNVYVAGLTTFPPQDRDHAAIKYAADGDEEWTLHWAGPNETNDRALDIAVSVDGAVAIVGEVFNPAHQNDATVLVYQQQSATGIDPAPSVSLRVTPNPFSSETSVAFRDGADGPATIEVFDLRGRRVRTLRSASSPVIWDGRDDRGRPLSSGTYLLRLETPAGMATRPISLVR